MIRHSVLVPLLFCGLFVLNSYAKQAPTLESIMEEAMTTENLRDLQMRSGIHVGEVTIVYRAMEDENLSCDGGSAFVYVDGKVWGDEWASPPTAGSVSFGTALAGPDDPNTSSHEVTIVLVTRMRRLLAMGTTRIPEIPGYKIASLLGFSPASFGELSMVMDLPESDDYGGDTVQRDVVVKLPAIQETSAIIAEGAALTKLMHDPGFTHPICGSIGRAPRQRNGEADAPYRIDGEFGLSRTASCCKRNARPKPSKHRSSTSTIISKLATKHQRAIRVWCTAYADATFHPFFNNCTGLFRAAKGHNVDAVAGVTADVGGGGGNKASSVAWHAATPEMWAAVPVEPPNGLSFGTCAVVLPSEKLSERKMFGAIDSQYAVFRVGVENIRKNHTTWVEKTIWVTPDGKEVPSPHASVEQAQQNDTSSSTNATTAAATNSSSAPAPPPVATTAPVMAGSKHRLAALAAKAAHEAAIAPVETVILAPQLVPLEPLVDTGTGVKDTLRVLTVEESLGLCQKLGNFTGPKYIAVWEPEAIGRANAATSCLKSMCTSCEWVGAINPQFVPLISTLRKDLGVVVESNNSVPSVGEVAVMLASFTCSTASLFGYGDVSEAGGKAVVELLKAAEVVSVRF